MHRTILDGHLCRCHPSMATTSKWSRCCLLPERTRIYEMILEMRLYTMQHIRQTISKWLSYCLMPARTRMHEMI